jgi:hypothetical protein
MAAVFGLGRFLQPLFPRNFSKVDRFAATALSGLGLLGTLFFLVGMIRFSLATVLVVLVPLAALGAVRWARESTALLPALRRARPPSIMLRRRNSSSGNTLSSLWIGIATDKRNPVAIRDYSSSQNEENQT